MQKKLLYKLSYIFQTFHYRLILQNTIYNFACLHLTGQVSISSKEQRTLNFK